MVRNLGIKVLIADDSAFLRKTIADILLENKSLVISGEAKNGREAIDKVQLDKPDVLVLDLIMPEMNGLDALQKIMEIAPTPTIILSAVSPQNMDSSIQALLLGAFDYVIKPGGLGAKDLPRFREELLEKVQLAAQSPIKRILEKENKITQEKSAYFRQEIVSETFKFGKYINTLKPIQEIESNEKPSDLVLNKVESENKKPSIEPEMIKPAQSTEKSSEITINLKNEINLEQKLIPVPKEKVVFQNKNGESKIEQKSNVTSKKEKLQQLGSEEKLISRSTNFDSSLTTTKKIDRKIKIEKKSLPYIKEPKSRNSQIKSDLRLITKKESSIDLKGQELSDRNAIGKKVDRAIVSKSSILTNKVIVIGASVGGPRTIRSILKNIPSELQCPILIVQHLGGNFVSTFVNTLNESCALPVKIAQDEEYIEPGVIYVAPGGMHMEISLRKNHPCVKTFIGPPVHFVTPSVDLLFLSAAKVYQNRTLGILLTGMGEDGVEGLGAIQKAGGNTIAESEETCILYGMPKFAAERGFANIILPNYKIIEYILGFAR